MVIFKYEIRNHAKYIFVWAIALAVCIFLMIPVYYSLLNGAESSANPLYETLGSSDFFQSVGVSMEYLTAPLGIYSFLTSFFMLASGIFGMHFGMSIHTKEFSGKTSEYLFTKPHTRREIFCAKALTVLCGVLIVSISFIAASALSLCLFQPGFDGWEFFLVANSLLLLTLFFSALGLLIGVMFSGNRSPLLTAGLVAFAAYCTTSFSRIVGNENISYFSPYSYFSAAEISHTGFYELNYLVCYVILIAGFLVEAYHQFLIKDIQFRS